MIMVVLMMIIIIYGDFNDTYGDVWMIMAILKLETWKRGNHIVPHLWFLGAIVEPGCYCYCYCYCHGDPDDHDDVHHNNGDFHHNNGDGNLWTQ